MTNDIPAKWNGSCEAGGEDFNSSVCNYKLIGARYFNEGLKRARFGKIKSKDSASDTLGHGTMVSSIAAGNYVNGVSSFGYSRGVSKCIAPHARFAIYKVMWNEGIDSSDVLAGIDQAISDGVDVISVSFHDQALHCDNVDYDGAYRLLDEMVFNGAFPDSFTYNVIFSCLVKNEKVRDASKFFVEMVKNEFPPSSSSFAAAIKMFFRGEEPEIELQVWNFMADNGVKPHDTAANALLLGLNRLGRLTKLRRTLEDMLDKRIDIYESAMESLKNAYYKEGRRGRDKYESLSRRWKSSLAH